MIQLILLACVFSSSQAWYSSYGGWGGYGWTPYPYYGISSYFGGHHGRYRRSTDADDHKLIVAPMRKVVVEPRRKVLVSGNLEPSRVVTHLRNPGHYGYSAPRYSTPVYSHSVHHAPEHPSPMYAHNVDYAPRYVSRYHHAPVYRPVRRLVSRPAYAHSSRAVYAAPRRTMYAVPRRNAVHYEHDAHYTAPVVHVRHNEHDLHYTAPVVHDVRSGLHHDDHDDHYDF